LKGFKEDRHKSRNWDDFNADVVPYADDGSCDGS
jgi:hypothetical protein